MRTICGFGRQVVGLCVAAAPAQVELARGVLGLGDRDHPPAAAERPAGPATARRCRPRPGRRHDVRQRRARRARRVGGPHRARAAGAGAGRWATPRDRPDRRRRFRTALRRPAEAGAPPDQPVLAPGAGTTPWGAARWLRDHVPAAGRYRVRLVDARRPRTSEADLGRRHRARGRAPGAPGGRVVRPAALRPGAARRRQRGRLAGLRADQRQVRLLDHRAVRARRLAPVLGFDRLHAVCCRPEAAGTKLSYPTRRLDPVTSTPAARPDLPAQFVPGEVEAGLYARWVERGYFEADPKSDEPPFCIVIPPPNVTGSLHIGHAFEHTLHRHPGPPPPHAGLRRAVAAGHGPRLDRRARARREGAGGRGHEPPRARPRGVPRAHVGVEGRARRRDPGADAPARRQRRLDARALHHGRGQAPRRPHHVQAAVRRRPDLPRRAAGQLVARAAHRAVGLEVEHKEVDGELVSIRYGDGDDAIVVATTRVETMLGDTAVAVHPDDERYRHLVGRRSGCPVGRRIPILADDARRPGVRYRRGQGHAGARPQRLRDRPPARPADADDHGRARGHHGARSPSSTEWTGSRRAGRSARRSGAGRIVAEKRPYRHSVGHSSRAPYEPIEPRLSLQWFVKVGPLAKAAGDAVREGRVTVHPKELEPRWFAWVDNMYDWCISRQLWWGHRIPVWYGPDGEVACLGPDEEPPGRLDGRTPTSSTPGSPRGCGRSRRWAGPRTPSTCAASTRRPCWSRATTSSSSGWPG